MGEDVGGLQDVPLGHGLGGAGEVPEGAHSPVGAALWKGRGVPEDSKATALKNPGGKGSNTMSAAPWLHPGGRKCARILTHPYSGASPDWAYTATTGTLRHEHGTHVQKYGSPPTHYTSRGIQRHTLTHRGKHTSILKHT